MALTWYACDLYTGRILGELPLSASRDIQVRITREDSTTFQLPLAAKDCPPDWQALVVGGKTMNVLTTTTNGREVPVQGWSIEDHVIGGTSVDIIAKTLETCLARTNVPDHDPDPDEDLSTTAAALLGELPARFGFTIETTPSGTPVGDRSPYSRLEDRSVLTAMNEDINGADNGPEWRIALRWSDDTRRGFTKVVQVKPKVGIDRPHTVFELDADGKGNISTYTRRPSFAAGKGGTMFIGTSDGSGESRPMTDPILSHLVDEGWPVWEERIQFTGLGQGDEDEDTELQRRTLTAGVQRQAGTVVWAITGRPFAPQAGEDYDPGDMVRLDIAPQGYDTVDDRGNPRRVVLDRDGGKSSPRVLGFDLNTTTGLTQPVLMDDEESNG